MQRQWADDVNNAMTANFDAYMHTGFKWYKISAFIPQTKTSFPWAAEWASEGAIEQMSAEKRASKASSAEQDSEWAVQANERVDERIAQFFKCRFHNHSTQFAAPGSSWFLDDLTVRPMTVTHYG